MEDKTGGPAFPNALLDESSKACHLVDGMTLRDYFAAKAMQGIFSHGNLEHDYFPDYEEGRSNIARISYLLADAMLNQREK